MLKDVLERQPEVREVRHEPDAIQKRFLAAVVAPDRVEPPTGPEPPQVEVRWTTTRPHDTFRIDHTDPNVGFHCGWHRDESHPELGRTRFQFERPDTDGPRHEEASFDAESPARILWTCLERLFGDVIPEATDDIG